jgi:aminopeptidase N
VSATKHLSLLAALSLLCLVQPAGAATPNEFVAAQGRLPRDVRPLAYTLDLVPDLATLTTHGRESVLLEFRAQAATIQFNSLGERLGQVRFDGHPVRAVVSDDAAQLTTVTLPRAAAVGRHTLSFRFHGVIERDPRGLYVLQYRDARGAIARLLSTQMESTDARRMFPCWDEPAFRATFELRTTQPAAWAVIGNMPVEQREVRGALATTRFARSPPMPSYLVEYTTGDLAALHGAAGRVAIGVWAMRGQEPLGATALQSAELILPDYEQYFGVRFPLPKLDFIAVPGGWDGAMENWGAITFADNILLFTPGSALQNAQDIFATQAHEMAHLWNGDLVTMAWWDDLWLNESFAEWMADRETALRHPEWDYWLLKDADRESAMAADARATSHAIQRPVRDELQASTAFDSDITYDKGASVLRMLEANAGPDAFRAGIRGFLQEHAYSNATSGDLWRALDAATGRQFGAIAAGWTEQPGFPLVTVSASCDGAGARTLTLSQRRFLLDGADAQQLRWRVPLQVRDAPAEPPHGEMLTADGQQLAAGRCTEPLSVNAGAIGYYRVAYDAATLDLDTRNFARLPDADGIALLDDQWALAETGAAPLGSYLDLVASLSADRDPRSWQQAISALGTIEFAERGLPGHDRFVAYARSLLAPAYAALGALPRSADTPAGRAVRRLLAQALGMWGDEAVVADMRRRFSLLATGRQTAAPEDQAVILAVVARNADAATFSTLNALAVAAPDMAARRREFAALAEVADPALAADAVRIALSDELPPQDDFLRLHMIVTLAALHPQLSWDALTANVGRLTSLLTDSAQTFIAQAVPAAYWRGLPQGDIETWVRAHVDAELSDDIARGLETARFQLAAQSRLVTQADARQWPRPKT